MDLLGFDDLIINNTTVIEDETESESTSDEDCDPCDCDENSKKDHPGKDAKRNGLKILK